MLNQTTLINQMTEAIRVSQHTLENISNIHAQLGKVVRGYSDETVFTRIEIRPKALPKSQNEEADMYDSTASVIDSEMTRIVHQLASDLCSSKGLDPYGKDLAHWFSSTPRSNHLHALIDWIKSQWVNLQYGFDDLDFFKDELNYQLSILLDDIRCSFSEVV